ncbi:hypothetical protein JRC04_27445 [Mycolicibacterium sp. S2-37]|uniref:hypothetical protein n=1 Tax=Mycolicibacterium sp. S2-37 TaxID=2810297 RepID=UPI001A94EE61|nr:hypothetical protein [Mycolicibacterium sp. S2-37]MBO0679817.1 hypothetical protein [Mycolicibacterium sp. S2-37]MBO0681214.1 hypothetical protein [Mycolicibacterium sp. S2-37]
MSGTTRDPAALLRGVAAAGFTAPLAVAAHAAADGSLTAGPAVTGVAVVALTVGALTATVRRADRMPVLLALLGAGQLTGHAVLGSSGHAHGGAAAPAAMLVAHAVAVALGAALIAAGGRLCAALSRAVRVVVRLADPRPAGPPAIRWARSAHHGLQALSMFAGPVSRRGPPAGAAR